MERYSKMPLKNKEKKTKKTISFMF